MHNKQYSQIVFTTKDKQLQESIIAMLQDLDGLTGFEEQDDCLIAYGNDTLNTDALRQFSKEQQVDCTISFIDEKNWNEEWEQNFQPVLIDDFCYIHADFHPTIQQVQHDIIITPKMSFGTGHHATTQMMIQLMKPLIIENKSVLDYGTGTGVLAILAAKMGADKIIAIDNDEWSFENANENCTRNIVASKIEVQLGTIENIAGAQFDIVLANINRQILLDTMPAIATALFKNGTLLLSGILAQEDEAIILESATSQGFSLIKTLRLDKWAAMNFVLG